jgi:spore coat protein CotH
MNYQTRLLLVSIAGFVSSVIGCGRPDPPPPPPAAAENEIIPSPVLGSTNQGAASVSASRELGQPSAARPRNKGSKPSQDDIFAKPTLVNIEIEIPRTGMSLLRRTQWGGGGGEVRPTARATVREGGVVYTNVAVHLKGAAGSFRPVDDEPALTLNFDKFVPGQSFHGLHKISLNNSVQDRSYLSEKICRELFDAGGVPVPRAGYAIVRLNGRGLGLYVLLEGANKQFLKRYFKNTKGNLYDGGFVRDVDDSLWVNSGDNPDDRSDLRTFTAALNQRGMASLSKVLDVDRFVSMIAMEVMVLHWDGYALNKNNWRLFHDLDSDKMVFIPHGMDQTFGISQRCGPEIRPSHWSGHAASAVMRTPEGSKLYNERFAQLYTNVFKLEEVLRRVDEIEAAIQPVLAQYDPQAARSQNEQAEWFKLQIARRHAYIGTHLGVPATTVKFGSDGAVRLSGWKQVTGRTSNANLGQAKDEQGNLVYGISATGNGINSGFWRTRVTLGPGQYRFEGKVRVQGVMIQEGDQRAGAGLRVSQAPMQPHLTGSSAWTPYGYEFAVEDEATEVELICELTRTLQGEALFDANSLRLVRLR